MRRNLWYVLSKVILLRTWGFYIGFGPDQVEVIPSRPWPYGSRLGIRLILIPTIRSLILFDGSSNSPAWWLASIESFQFLFVIERIVSPWWRHQMETFSALLAICAGNSPVPGEFPAQKPVTRSFDVFFDLRLNKRLSKHSWVWWFETLSHPLWRHRNDPGGHSWEHHPGILSLNKVTVIHLKIWHRSFHLLVLDLRMSGTDFTTRQGTRILATATATGQHVLMNQP